MRLLSEHKEEWERRYEKPWVEYMVRSLFVVVALLPALWAFQTAFYEKQRGQLSFLKQNGLMESVFWVSNALAALQFALVSSLIMTLMVYLVQVLPATWQYPFLSNTNPFVFMLISFVACFGFACFLFFVSAWTSSAVVANRVVGVFVLGGLVNAIVSQFLNPEPEGSMFTDGGKWWRILYFFVPSWGYTKCLSDVVRVTSGFTDSHNVTVSKYSLSELTMRYEFEVRGSKYDIESTLTTLALNLLASIMFLL